MKYIAFLKVAPEDVSGAWAVDQKRKAEGKYVKILFPPHVIANTSEGISEFIIFESDDELEIAEYVQAYTKAGCKIEVYPIWESKEGFPIWEKL